MVSPGEVPAAGGMVQVAIVVRNVGSASAEDVALKIRPPAGATLGGEEPGALPAAVASAETADTPFWQCDFGSDWRCTYGAVAAGSQAETLNLPLRLPPASVGDVVTVSATVSTSSLEAAADNNTDKAKIAYTAVADLSSWRTSPPTGGSATSPRRRGSAPAERSHRGRSPTSTSRCCSPPAPPATP
jgi:hypothetical protein